MEDELLKALEPVANDPFNIKHHAAYIRLASQMQDGGEMAADARSQMVNAVPATSNVWLPLLRHNVATLDLNTIDGAGTLLELFAHARNDYLSIPVLKLQIETLVDLNSREDLSEEVREIWGDQQTRENIQKLVRVGAAHISKSHEIWNLWREWEVGKIEDLRNAEARADAVARVDAMFLERMRQIHIDYTTTSDSYSTFVTAHFPPQHYEKKLVQATKIRESALRMLSWKELKITREQLELKAQRGSIEDWKAYILWEKKGKKVQSRLVPVLYERAVECAASERWAAVLEKEEEEEARFAAAEAALRGFWEDYLGFQMGEKETPPTLINLARRATKSVPGSGSMWSAYLRLLDTYEGEEIKDLETVPEAYERAMSMNTLQPSPDDFVLVVMARAAWRRRKCFGEEGGEVTFDEDGVADVLHVLQEGITAIRKHPGGDLRMRLEGFLADFYITFPPASMPEQALEVWQDATKFYSKSYLAWLAYVNLLIKEKQISSARKVLKDLTQRKGIDWPEAIWERWISLEHLFGRNEDVQKCLTIIAVQRRVEEERRRKAWATVGFPYVYQQAGETAVQPQAQEAMEVDTLTPAAGEGGAKRKREEEDVGVKDSPSKRAKTVEEPAVPPPAPATALTPDVAEAQAQLVEPLKRDRENATMLVAQLPTGTTAEDLNKLFKDCGAIREVQLRNVAMGTIAMVEFYSSESVLPALTKDKKRIHDQEIAVSVAWRSTLYVTNFREGMDDSQIRELFSKFGTILDVRWPSKRIKTTRRFCYVQYTSPDHAQAALSLTGTETEPGLAMGVYISDPARKKERTDAGSKEIRVTGVAKSVTKADLENLFAKYGQVKDVRLVPAAGGNRTAFVDFTTEEDAQVALAVNNQLLKGRRLAVILADANTRKSVPGSRQDAAARSLRVKNLPEDTQEPLLQQAFEKLVPVKRVEVLVDSREAIVELVNLADVGRLLLSSDAIEFGGKFLEISEEHMGAGRRGPPSGPSRPKAGIGARGGRGGLGFAVPRQAARKRTAEPVERGATQGTPAPIPAGLNGNAPKAGPKGQDDFRKMLGL